LDKHGKEVYRAMAGFQIWLSYDNTCAKV